MAHTRVWDDTVPPDSQAVAQGAQRIREFRVDVSERMALDHVWEVGVDTDGLHKKVTLGNLADPTAVADSTILFSKDVSAVSELHVRKESGVSVQLTSGSGINQAGIGAEASTISTVVRRDASGDINVRLCRTEYANDDSSTIAAVAYRVNNSSDNYIRHATLTRFKRQLTLNHTIQSDPGGTPSGSPGDVFEYY